ncbi:MAG: T9SS type A sorting domain-containing protein [Chitinophagales bacterium]
MKHLLLLLIPAFLPSVALSQQLFHFEELKKVENPYLYSLPKYLSFPFSLEKITPRELTFKLLEEQYDYYNTGIGDWQPSFKFDYSYLANARLDILNEFNYDPASAGWINSKRTSFGYDVFGFQSIATEEAYDATSGGLKNNALYELQHESNGNLEEEKISYWNSLGSSWLANHKHDYEYDASNKEIEVTHEDWIDSISAWNAYSEYFSSYNSAGNLVRYLGLAWNEDSMLWLNETKDTMVYDLQQQVTHSETQLWSAEKNTWSSYFGNDYEYDAQGNLIQLTGLFWDDVAEAFQNSTQYDYQFTNDRLDEIIFQLWDNNSGEWENFNNTHFSYDTTGLLIQKIISNWNGSGWAESYQYLYNNDENGNLLESVGQSWNGGTGTWINIERYTASWMSVMTASTSITVKENKLFIYPNPAVDQLIINGISNTENYSAAITDMSGKLLIDVEIFDEMAVDLKALSSGTYLLYIKENSRTVVTALPFVISK